MIEAVIMRKSLVIILFTVLVPTLLSAQDYTSVYALDDDYKRLRKVLETRAEIEYANAVLHNYSKEATLDYKDLNESLDKYTKCFDVISIIYQGGKMVLNLKDTYSEVNDKAKELKDLVEDFMKKCTARGDIVSSDTLIVGSCKRAVEKIGDDGEDIFNSFKDLALYVSGKTDCSTEKLVMILEDINRSLDDIKQVVNRTYYVIWKYVTIRLHYWKAPLYRARTVSQMANDAIEKWLEVSGTVGY